MKVEKILSKKMVRGKPYYKVKWHGKHKDEATWESPPSLLDVKHLINNYEKKCWGTPLNEKFFDEDLYQSKNFPIMKSKSKDKKTRKRMKEEAKGQIKSEIYRDSEEQEFNVKEESQIEKIKPFPDKFSERMFSLLQQKAANFVQINQNREQFEEERVPHKETIEHDFQRKKLLKENQPPRMSTRKQRKLLLERDDEEQVSNIQSTREMVLRQTPRRNYIIDIPQGRKTRLSRQERLKEMGLKDEGLFLPDKYGLFLPEKQPSPEPHQPQQEREQEASPVITQPVEVEPQQQAQICQPPSVEESKQVRKIFHLQKPSQKVHVYLVEYNDGQLTKMTTDQLLEEHTESFLEALETMVSSKVKIR